VVSEGSRSNNWIHVTRRTEPSASLPEGFQTTWNKLKTRSFPYNGLIESQNGETRITTSVQPPGPGSARVRYGLGVTLEGTQTQRDMARKLDLLQHSFTALADDGR